MCNIIGREEGRKCQSLSLFLNVDDENAISQDSIYNSKKLHSSESQSKEMLNLMYFYSNIYWAFYFS